MGYLELAWNKSQTIAVRRRIKFLTHQTYKPTHLLEWRYSIIFLSLSTPSNIHRGERILGFLPRKMPSKTLILLLLLQLVIFSLVHETKGKVPAIIVFGDSSVDAGNNNAISTLLKSNFQPYGRDFQGGRPTGRFSNGRIPPDFISEAFGLRPFVPAYLDPQFTVADFATGVCFASAGTGYDNVTSNVLNVIPLWKELEYYKDYQTKLRSYLGEDKARETITEALYLMSLGTNDFLENYYSIPTRRTQLTVGQFQDFLIAVARNFIAELYNLGARKMSLTGVPPMGCLPLERATNIMGRHDCVQEYNVVAVQFNAKLEGMVSQLNKDLPGMKILFSRDLYDYFYRIIRGPASYGFEVTSLACCATGTFEMSYLCNRASYTCPDASKYVFWDAFHPTEKTNKILSDQIIPVLLNEFQ